VIKENSRDENEADFGFFVNGEKVEEVEDDESMYVYDMLYQQFKEECRNADIKCYQWIDGDSLEESEIHTRLSIANFS
jgi:hypothetical protein